VERRPLNPLRLSKRSLLIYITALASYGLTAALFYGIYSVLGPQLSLPESLQPIEGPFGTSMPSYLLFLYVAFRSGAALIYFFSLFLILVFLNEVSYILLGILHKHLARGRLENVKNRLSVPLVSIIVPAYNEEKVIGNTIRTLLEVDYARKEIIVVNDGSVDRTREVVEPYAERRLVRLINRPNGGKAVALNTGIASANGEIIVAVDADSLVERGSLKRLIAHFQDPDVAAVSGNVKVGNRVNLLTRLQALEYIREINLRRRAFDLLNTVYVVPGAIGAFRKNVYWSVGSYDKDTVTEDMDTTLKFVKTGHLVLYEADAIAHTEAPESLRDWFKQRMRWFGGSMQVVLKHRIAWWRHGSLSLIGLPYLMLSMLFVPVVELTALVVGVVYAAVGLGLGIALAFLAAMSVEFVCSIISIFIDDEDPRLALYTPVYVILYRYLSDIVRMRSLYDIYRGKLGWTRPERYGELPQKIRS